MRDSRLHWESIRRANGRMSGEQVVFDAQTMNEIIADSLAERRFTMILFGVFAALARSDGGAALRVTAQKIIEGRRRWRPRCRRRLAGCESGREE